MRFQPSRAPRLSPAPPLSRTLPPTPIVMWFKPGDSLYKIAKTVLGSGRKADALLCLEQGHDRS